MSEKVDAILSALRAEPIDVDAIAELLDRGTHEDRIAAIRRLSPKLQRRLFASCAGRAVTTEAIVAPGTGPLKEVIHEGQNTLPAFRTFQKRFCLPSEEHRPDNRRILWGYNHQTLSGITGPGYFVAYDDEEVDEVVIDYRELPPERPEHWPPIIDNRAKLGRFVYAGMVDRLRRVSEHVTIGRAYKSKPMNAYFALVRAD